MPWLKAAKSDWRPLFSYPANMERLGDAALNTDAAWVKIARVMDSSQSRASMMFGVPPGAMPFNPNQQHDERRFADKSILAIPLALVGGRAGWPFWTFTMDHEHAREIAGPPALSGDCPNFRGVPGGLASGSRIRENGTVPLAACDVVEFDGVSKWYGNVIGLNRLSVRIAPGVTGLLGPNGAGKSTFLQLATGQLRPSQGEVRVLGHRPWNNSPLMRHVGLCPEQDAFYEWMTGRDFVRTCARLTGMSRSQASAAAEQAIATVGMTENCRRAIRGYSKGMRQRIKLAQALVHEPRVLFLDEPFTGTDPVARHDLLQVIRSLGESGRSVIVSSHVLHEIETLTRTIILMHRGRLVAEGRIEEIRDLIDRHPHRIVLVCDDYRALAARTGALGRRRRHAGAARSEGRIDRDAQAGRVLFPPAGA